MLRRALLSVVLAVGLSGPAASDVSSVVNLGGAGLTTVTRLYLHDGSSWAAVDPNPVTVVELGNGEYYLDDLPTASGSERYHVVVALAASPDVSLREYTYGAKPGTQIVWRHQVDAPAPNVFKVGQSYGSIQLEVSGGLPEAIGDGLTTATFSAIAASTGTAVLDSAPAVISNVVEDLEDGGWGCLLTYALDGTEWDGPGVFLGEFEVTFPDGSVLPLPQDDRLRIRVNRAITPVLAPP